MNHFGEDVGKMDTIYALSRAIKIPLLPFVIAMFGLGFAILRGILVDKLMKK